MNDWIHTKVSDILNYLTKEFWMQPEASLAYASKNAKMTLTVKKAQLSPLTAK